MAKRIAGGFGAGMGYIGETCGAVTGALMLIGLKQLFNTLCPKFVRDSSEIIEELLELSV